MMCAIECNGVGSSPTWWLVVEVYLQQEHAMKDIDAAGYMCTKRTTSVRVNKIWGYVLSDNLYASVVDPLGVPLQVCCC